MDMGQRSTQNSRLNLYAGVVGLAVARRLAQEGREVVVLESASDIGTSTSSRNSEVIHAGAWDHIEMSKSLFRGIFVA